MLYMKAVGFLKNKAKILTTNSPVIPSIFISFKSRTKGLSFRLNNYLPLQ